MTYWGPLDVSQFCERAGWPRADRGAAVAVALCASDGADHYRWIHPSTPAVDQRGLWALDVSRVGDDDPNSLYDPAYSAELVRQLWERYGRTWQWHGAWQTDGGWTVSRMLAWLNEGKNWNANVRSTYGMPNRFAG